MVAIRRSFQKETETAIQAVIAASTLCIGVRASSVGGSTIVKRDQSPVTIADFGSQAVVCRILGEAFPHVPIVAEEDSRQLTGSENEATLREVVHHVNQTIPGASPEQICSWIDSGCQEPAERFWTLDPIDGTKGFLRGDQYAIALALVEEGEVRLGVLGCPNLLRAGDARTEKRGTVFLALRGQRTFQTDVKGRRRTSVTVSRVTTPSRARLTESFESAHSDHVAHERIARRFRMTTSPLRMDSQAKYAVLARGEASVYLRLPSPNTPDYREKIWDHAAGSIILEEAGGKVTDAYGRALDFAQGRRLENNRGIVATNRSLHDVVLEAIEFELRGDR